MKPFELAPNVVVQKRSHRPDTLPMNRLFCSTIVQAFSAPFGGEPDTKRRALLSEVGVRWEYPEMYCPALSPR